MQTERFETVVIGGGQAGLAMGYHLAQRDRPFVILDASAHIGDAWRTRWDSLRLFSPAAFNGLPGMGCPAPDHTFITKDQMADFLAAYAQRFELPVRSGVKVDRLTREGGRYVVSAGQQRFEADNVIVAMAGYQQPRVPAFSGELDPDIVQLHSSQYRNPSQLKPGGVLLVGAGNSGAEIAVEVARDHPTWLAGRVTGAVPFRMDGLLARLILARLVLGVFFHRVLTVDTPIGRKARPAMLHSATPLIRTREPDIAAARVERVPRVAGVQNGRPALEDGRTLDVANVIWCTGYEPGFDWIDLPIHGPHEPLHERGLVPTQPGLYFVGLHFLYALSSSMVNGVGRDAERIARAIAARAPAPASSVSGQRPRPPQRASLSESAARPLP